MERGGGCARARLSLVERLLGRPQFPDSQVRPPQLHQEGHVLAGRAGVCQSGFHFAEEPFRVEGPAAQHGKRNKVNEAERGFLLVGHVENPRRQQLGVEVAQVALVRLERNRLPAVLTGDGRGRPQVAGRGDLALLDPPYGGGLAGRALTALGRGRWLKPGALAVVELAAKEPFVPPPDFDSIDERRYGATRFVILRWTG